ncbi:putative PPPDE peptidase domain-containing protein [Helianthus annuus]|nr:putative PPPDE peptidase domain-containing protein [Helianthus annuus]KAJ0756127.1 putative PPPDE peptidase domain-containing protein [Helianthus annuus]KAJ0759905.1 putative PPPDE peptidase domain-containing protein [Helianthus annuus]
MLCRGSKSVKCRKAGSIPVYLNVYDLTSMNEYAYWLGLGIYHSGVQVHRVEYAFGSHEEATTGIFEGEPKKCEGFTFRKQILIGWTDLNPKEVKRVMDELAHIYKGTSYSLFTRNCNHFCNDVCIRLTGNSIPSWINRLARIGLLCNCIVPSSVNSTKIGIEDDKSRNEAEIKAKLKSRSSRFTSSSSSPSLSSDASSPVRVTRVDARTSFSFDCYDS